MINKDSFAERATTWDEDPKKIEMTKRYVDEVLKHVDVQKDWKMLEIGAGTGLVGIQFLPRIKSMVFEDTSEAMLGVLKQKLSSEEKEKSHIFLGEVTELVENGIDFAVSLMVFHHIEDIESVLNHLFLILKPNGVVAIADVRTEDGSFHRFQPIPHKGFDTDALATQFEKAGFSVKSVHTYNTLKREREPGIISDYEQFLIIAKKEC
jgi:ubiquinone/menaquinone biosynthesis C-methylase UbiE